MHRIRIFQMRCHYLQIYPKIQINIDKSPGFCYSPVRKRLGENEHSFPIKNDKKTMPVIAPLRYPYWFHYIRRPLAGDDYSPYGFDSGPGQGCYPLQDTPSVPPSCPHYITFPLFSIIRNTRKSLCAMLRVCLPFAPASSLTMIPSAVTVPTFSCSLCILGLLRP